MAQQGWISLHRSIQDHWLWNDKPFDKSRAWIDLLLSANHQANKFLLGNELVEVERGSFITSELKLMDRWGWSKTKLRNFLELLEKDNMLLKKSDRKKTTLTIVNYSVYQETGNHEETAKRPLEDRSKTAKRPLEDTNNNVNNDNNDNNFLSDSNEYRLADYLRKWILKNNPTSRVPNDIKLQAWCKTIKFMIEIDKREIEDIKQHIQFSQTDTFWKTNLLSADKLRKQYDQLTGQMNNKKNPVAKDKQSQIYPTCKTV